MAHDGLEIHWVTPRLLRVVGELDISNARWLREELEAAAAAELVVDCESLTFLDSSGVSMLIAVFQAREGEGCTMRLRHVQGPPRRTLEIAGLLETLEG